MLRIPASNYGPSAARSLLSGALLGLALLASPGCFVSEELDRGAQLMDQHSATPKDVASRPPKPGLTDRARVAVESAEDWWSSLTQPAPDANPIVDCRLSGGQAFVVESDCLARGGWVRP